VSRDRSDANIDSNGNVGWRTWMSVQFGNTAPDFRRDSAPERFHPSIENDRAAFDREFFAASETERRWPPIWRLAFIAGASAGLWLLIILAVLITGALQLLP
jgi:hypothetical protein